MNRIAILGGGISGLTAAYALELQRQKNPDIDWHLYEATDRLGGILGTTHIDGYTLEDGPDAWVTEKPHLRDLAIELGLKDQLTPSNDATRKTYILHSGELLPIPDRMRLMVPEDLSTLENSPLFTPTAKAAYAAELARAAELKATPPGEDESIASFVLRHFGPEVLDNLAAPLLSGVFGGDVHKLSVRAVMPAFVAMEREHGSLIAALQARTRSRSASAAIFTTLRDGMATLIDALIARLPADRLHLNHPAFSIKREGKLWCLRYHTPSERGIPGKAKKHVKHLILATPLDVTRDLLTPRHPELAALLPADASSALLATFTWPEETARTFEIPQGFGFLAPPPSSTTGQPQLLAATFATQKFPHRAPNGARVLRAFFGSEGALHFANDTDAEVANAALAQLATILGPLPPPEHTTVRRLPRSLPQYEVGHPDRITRLNGLLSQTPGLHLLGNAYNGVGLPDLVHTARATVRGILSPVAHSAPTPV